MPNTQAVHFRRDIPVRQQVDVFVAGGGPAGLAAALAAARQGRSVFLAEGHTCFGGMGTAGMVPVFMQFTDGVNFLAGGIGKEILDRAVAEGAILDPDWAAINVESLKRVYDSMVEESGIGFAFQTQAIAVEKETDSRVSHVICSAKSGIFAVKAEVFVDCTGDGDLAVWAGAPFEKGDAKGLLMPGTLCSLWANIDWERVRQSGLNAEECLPKAFADGVFTNHDRHLPGMYQVGEDIGGGNIGHTFNVDGTDERTLTDALIWGRKSLLEYERFYKQYLKGYERMTLISTGSLLGIRETRRIIGDYILNLDDFLSRATFEDEIGRYAYPVDIHPSAPTDEDFAGHVDRFANLRYGPGESYGIPYRTLTPLNLDNVLVAGRCISSDRSVQGSIRVMPGCFITGQAAGVAAAMASEKKSDIRGVNVRELQSRLASIGGRVMSHEL